MLPFTPFTAVGMPFIRKTVSSALFSVEAPLFSGRKPSPKIRRDTFERRWALKQDNPVLQTGGLSLKDAIYVREVDALLAQSWRDQCRDRYAVEVLLLRPALRTAEIIARTPQLSSQETQDRIGKLARANPKHAILQRLWAGVIGQRVETKSDESVIKLSQAKSAVYLAESQSGVYSQPYKDAMKVCQDRLLAYLEFADKQARHFGYDGVIGRNGGDALREKAKSLSKILDQTDSLYWQAATQYLRRYAPKQADVVKTCDTELKTAIWFHPRLKELDKWFAPEKLMHAAVKTFDEGLGLDFKALSEPVDFKSEADFEQFISRPKGKARIFLDMEKRPGKPSRACVYGTIFPHEIFLTTPGNPGRAEYRSLLHEAGHALHFAYMKPDITYAEANLGGSTATETYAFLTEALLKNRHWLQHVIGLSQSDAQLAAASKSLADLAVIRAQACELQFQLNLCDGKPLGDKVEKYEQQLVEKVGMRYPVQAWPLNTDLNFYVTHYMTARLLEAQLSQYLKIHFGSPETQGEDWYTKPEAGKFLSQLWARGGISPEALAQSLCKKGMMTHKAYERAKKKCSPYDTAPYVQEVNNFLSAFSTLEKALPPSPPGPRQPNTGRRLRILETPTSCAV